MPSIDNTCRHYYTKYSLEYSQLTESNSQRNLKTQWNILWQNVFTKKKKLKWGFKQSFQVAHLLAKQGKPFTNDELIKLNLGQPKQTCIEKINLLKTIIILVRTDPWGIEDLGSSISTSQLKSKASDYEWFPVAFDEFTDVTGTAHLLLFIQS